MTATMTMKSDLLAKLNPAPAEPPAPPSDPISAARRGTFDRAAVRQALADAEKVHAARRPGLASAAQAARVLADTARAEAERLGREAAVAAAAVESLDGRLEHLRDRAAAVFAANPPARLVEAREALTVHLRDLRNGRVNDSDLPAVGRRCLAVTEALQRLDVLARDGVDGNVLDVRIGQLLAGIEAATVAEPSPVPVPSERLVATYSAVRAAGEKVRPGPNTGTRRAELFQAERELVAIRAGDPDADAKAAEIASKYRVKVPAAPQEFVPSGGPRFVSSDEE